MSGSASAQDFAIGSKYLLLCRTLGPNVHDAEMILGEGMLALLGVL